MELEDMADLKSVSGESLPGSSPGSRIFTSEYLARVPASKMDSFRCCYCGNPLLKIRLGERRPEFQKTRDHILPRERGVGRQVKVTDLRRRSRDHILPRAYGISGLEDVKSTEIMCQSCNQQRAACCHCWAIVACIKAVANSEHTYFDAIYRRWNLGKNLVNGVSE